VHNAEHRNGARLLFARTFFKNPIMLGSVLPSSRFLIKGVLDPIDWQRARVIVEYGPGVGTITMDMLPRMRPDARLILIEMNREFVRFLRESIKDPRVRVIEGSAADVRRYLAEDGLEGADYAISGIPLGSMPQAIRDRIVSETRAALVPGGAFVVYQFTSRIGATLRKMFGSVEHSREWLNVLPAHLFFCSVNSAKTNGHETRSSVLE
jgi:phospholipid N-methyltransferase